MTQFSQWLEENRRAVAQRDLNRRGRHDIEPWAQSPANPDADPNRCGPCLVSFHSACTAGNRCRCYCLFRMLQEGAGPQRYSYTQLGASAWIHLTADGQTLCGEAAGVEWPEDSKVIEEALCERCKKTAKIKVGMYVHDEFDD